MLGSRVVPRDDMGEQFLLLLLLLGQLGLHCLHLGDLGRVRNVPIRLREAQEMILIVQLEGIVGLGCSIPIHLNRIESHVHCIGYAREERWLIRAYSPSPYVPWKIKMTNERCCTSQRRSGQAVLSPNKNASNPGPDTSDFRPEGQQCTPGQASTTTAAASV